MNVRLSSLCLLIGLLVFVDHIAASRPSPLQDGFPSPPTDRSMIYIGTGANTLETLPFETGTTPLKTDQVAGSDKTSYIEVNGAVSEKAVNNALPRFYLFVSDTANVHPPFIVRLTQKNGARRVTAMSQKGLKGFAVNTGDIIKPHYRVLSHVEDTLYMEITPRESLPPGEYAIIGTSLQRIATFHIATPSGQ